MNDSLKSPRSIRTMLDEAVSKPSPMMTKHQIIEAVEKVLAYMDRRERIRQAERYRNELYDEYQRRRKRGRGEH